MADAIPPPAAAQSPPQTTPAPRGSLLIVFLVVVIDLLGFGIVLPLLPVFASEYVEQALGNPRAGAGGLVVGLLMASFSAMQLIFAPIWGRISDRVGRRPILLLGLAGSVVAYAVFAYASHLGFAGRPGLAGLDGDLAEEAPFQLHRLEVRRVPEQHLGLAEEEHPLRPQREVHPAEDLCLRVGVEVHQGVAAGEDVDVRDGGVLHQVVPAEDH